jgi:hypothetical protein
MAELLDLFCAGVAGRCCRRCRRCHRRHNRRRLGCGAIVQSKHLSVSRHQASSLLCHCHTVHPLLLLMMPPLLPGVLLLLLPRVWAPFVTLFRCHVLFPLSVVGWISGTCTSSSQLLLELFGRSVHQDTGDQYVPTLRKLDLRRNKLGRLSCKVCACARW